MFNAIMFFSFALLLLPKETRSNALVFVFGFSVYQFIYLADSLLLYLISPLTTYDTTFYHALSTTILCVILMKLKIKNDYISYIATLLVILMIVNAIGWVMYDSYIDKIYYNVTANTLIFSMLALLTWSWPRGRNIVKNRYVALVHSFNSKGDSMQTKQRKEKGVS